jgi:Leucine-rich repeat (LRR) protein
MNLSGLNSQGTVGTITIPPTIASLSHLLYLDLSKNQFQGHIPSFLGSLSKLTYLNLAFNSFTSIPSEISQLQHLRHLKISNNNLFGTIPSFIGFITSLTNLNLASNNLCQFLNLKLSNNQFAQTPLLFAPVDIINKSSISNELFHRNNSIILFVISRLILVLSHNSLNGSIPSGNISSSLTNLKLGSNFFVSPVFDSLGLGKLSCLSLSQNSLHSVPLFPISIESHLSPSEKMLFGESDPVFPLRIEGIWCHWI